MRIGICRYVTIIYAEKQELQIKNLPHRAERCGRNMCVSYGREEISAYLISRRRLAGISAAFFGIVSVRTPSV